MWKKVKTWKNEFADGSIWFATCVDLISTLNYTGTLIGILKELIKLIQW